MPAPEESAIVEFRGAGYRLEGDGAEREPKPGEEPRALVSGLDFTVRRGETLVLLGRSGSGKTTTLKLVNRLLEPTEGQVLVEGRSTTAWDPIRLRRSIGYVIQETGLFPHFTVERNIALVPSLEGWPRERIAARTTELMGSVGLDEKLKPRYPHELSGGQRQRVGVARALAADPPILLMDEPFGALDPITRGEIQAEFLRLEASLGKTVLFVTHDVREALMLATRIGLFEAGRLMGIWTPDEFRQSGHPAVAEYLRAFHAENERASRIPSVNSEVRNREAAQS